MKSQIFSQSDARQRRLIADVGSLAGLLKHPTDFHLQTLGKLRRRQKVTGLDDIFGRRGLWGVSHDLHFALWCCSVVLTRGRRGDDHARLVRRRAPF